MPETENHRHAQLTLGEGRSGPTLTAHIPMQISEEEFAKVSKAAYGMIHNLTKCNCLSGRISFIVEDLYTQVATVTLGPSAPIHAAVGD